CTSRPPLLVLSPSFSLRHLPYSLLLFFFTDPAPTHIYTLSLHDALPISQKNIADGAAKAVICNSGNANTCNADGVEKAQTMCDLAAQALGIEPQDVVVASTGVIGQALPMEPIQAGLPELVQSLRAQGSQAAATATVPADTP